MSQEQPGYYSPAPAGGQAPVPGTPSYQYVTPQPLDPSQQQYQQQQQFAQQPPPGTVLQQPYYPAQSPAPGFAQPSTVISPEFKEQPAAIYATEAHPAQPVVINVDGIERRGLMGKLHQFEMCCGFIPLHTGAMIIAILSVLLYGGFGLALLVSSTYSGTWYGIVFIILGIVYLGVAAISAAGFMGAYREDPKWVNIFVKFYVIGYFIWALIQIIQMGISVAYYSNYCSSLSYYGYSCGFGWAGWIIPFLIGLALQYYFCCCLVSYQRVLLAKLSGGDVEGGKTIEMH
ncbi:hypothetical protein EC957_011475 [Mortierella hygrophila]|uniref:Uncharacterized protein n=1 Tax=Mortierella hygrophila TaxID=979708 RepID=A0A9P6F7R9_9FUNG|nr:hypothetical protein EC957_011475 [Mortierella hygrophila]